MSGLVKDRIGGTPPSSSLFLVEKSEARNQKSEMGARGARAFVLTSGF
jgi:hypothetical protein